MLTDGGGGKAKGKTKRLFTLLILPFYFTFFTFAFLIPVVIEIVAFKTVAIGYVVSVVFRIELDGVEPDDNQMSTAFITGDGVSLLGLGINVNFFVAFGTNRCRHFC